MSSLGTVFKCHNLHTTVLHTSCAPVHVCIVLLAETRIMDHSHKQLEFLIFGLFLAFLSSSLKDEAPVPDQPIKKVTDINVMAS